MVTGYQRISRERSTAAFGFVDSEQLNRQMHSDLASSLEGQVAGLRMNINPNTGDMSPILRGVGTFSHDVGTESTDRCGRYANQFKLERDKSL